MLCFETCQVHQALSEGIVMELPDTKRCVKPCWWLDAAGRQLEKGQNLFTYRGNDWAWVDGFQDCALRLNKAIKPIPRRRIDDDVFERAVVGGCGDDVAPVHRGYAIGVLLEVETG